MDQGGCWALLKHTAKGLEDNGLEVFSVNLERRRWFFAVPCFPGD